MKDEAHGMNEKEEERILTLHPAGKTGVNIERWRYDVVRDAIFTILAEAGEAGTRFMKNKPAPEPDLFELVAPLLPEDWGDASVGWYTTSVKLDLEARREIERVPGATPQRLRLAGA